MLPGERMVKTQKAGMEKRPAQPAERTPDHIIAYSGNAFFPAVDAVAQDGMMCRRHVHSDLVGSPGMDAYPEE
jgi:hypothetical protein